MAGQACSPDGPTEVLPRPPVAQDELGLMTCVLRAAWAIGGFRQVLVAVIAGSRSRDGADVCQLACWDLRAGSVTGRRSP